MNERTEHNDEVSLLDLFAVLLRYKWLILWVTFAAAFIILIMSIISLKLPPEKSFLPNEYTPKALMLINDTSSSGGSLSSMLSSSGLGSLAGLAGVSVSGGATYSALAVYLTGTNTFLDAVVDTFDLVTRYKIKKFYRADSRRALKNNLSASFDDKTGVFSISFTDIDPEFAQHVVNFCVEYMESWFEQMGIDQNKLQKDNLEINIKNTYDEIIRLENESRNLEQSVSRYGAANIPSIMLESNRIKLELDAQREVYTQLKTQYELLKVTMASETPVFQVLEMAEVPDKKSGPGRGMLCIIVTFAAFFISVLLAFILNAIKNIKADPYAVAKLKGKKQP
ncbi:lipopolysaccharide biosynthesis protein [Brucepastera parasyntrophica]|uniref:lipopolysaccharide biosynthesis protein n=1 Tax=Brucepastera parasyntrophica TaxID=2880008 RepID=UPI002109334B|nr:lipopolysaccharide biosynthesis protein [Brucepastera parasyntrophica]ULQ59889.1 lipopolysaccharide biosynthesis protein [Brucepastera parasyntrophica]